MTYLPRLQLTKNMLIQWFSEEPPQIERILWISPDESYVYTMNVDEPHIPHRQEVEDIRSAYMEAEVTTLSRDIYMEDYLILEEHLTEKQRVSVEESWPIVDELSRIENGEAVFIPEKRGRLFRESSYSYKKLRRLFFAFWRSGQVPVALAPNYRKRGQSNQRNQSRQGRYPAITCVITPDMTHLMNKGYKQFYVRGKAHTLRAAYQQTIEKYFNNGYRKERNGVHTPILKPSKEIPSYNQFWRHCHVTRNIEKVSAAREGQSYTQLNLAPKKGSANLMSFGPGAWFFIDSTPADLTLVSALNRSWVIGNPTLYFVKDMFSMMIVGYALSLEEASWMSQMLALINAATPKVDHCAEYGISIKEEEWPSKTLPQFLLGDNGELASQQGVNLVKNLHIVVSNHPPYMPVLKSPVELDFHLLNVYGLNNLPGGGKRPQRAERDKKGLPCLTLHEAHQVIIHYILTYNSSHIQDEYAPPDKAMIGELVPPVPLSLWNWGIKNRSGILREFPLMVIYKSLLKREKGSISPQGIRFKGKRFEVVDNDLIDEEQKWLFAARTGNKSVEIAYDDRIINTVYLCLSDQRFIRCKLTDRENAFSGLGWDDLKQWQKMDRDKHRELKHEWQQGLARMNAQIKAIVDLAEAEALEQRKEAGISKHGLYKNLRAYRHMEKVLYRLISEENLIAQLEEPSLPPEPKEINEENIMERSARISDSAITSIVDDLMDKTNHKGEK